MINSIHGRMDGYVRRLSSQAGLAFSRVLTTQMVAEALQSCGVTFRDRLYNPAVTLWAFLWQTLSADHSCGDAVARVLAWRVEQGRQPCSANTGSYCQARGRLPLALLQNLLRRIGADLHALSAPQWRWKDRDVKVVDGTTVSMPDTPANQQAFPQARTQKPGLGFPIARLVVVFSLACGAALDLAVGPYKGKKTGENSLFRGLMGRIMPGDVVLADRCYSGYCDVALLRQRGADVVVRKHQLRKSNLRRARRLSKGEYLAIWRKPSRCPDGLDRQTFDQLPDRLELREVTIHVTQKAMRTRKLTLVTTLLDPQVCSKQDLADLYRRRWEAELDLRALKCVLQMDVLRCLTPQMVQKELWAHLLAYNAVRLLMAQAAATHDRPPDRLSFKGALQLLRAFHGAGLLADAAAHAALLNAIAQRTVPRRPNRLEPRAVKRRPKPHPLLRIPRSTAREALR